MNIDGFSPFKSRTLCVWPILVKVFKKGDVYYEPFTASVYAGHGKPKNQNDYLKSFFQEIQELMSDGLKIQNHHYQVRIKFFCCDCPARASLKSVLGHTAKNSRERCRVVGERVSGVTVFLSVNSQKNRRKF